MHLETKQFIDESILKEMDERDKFIKAQQIQVQQPIQADYLRPEKIKLEDCDYGLLKKNGKCVVSQRTLMGGGKASYEFKDYPFLNATGEKYHVFESGLPSYLRLRKIKGNSGKPNHYVVYLYDETMTDPVCYPIEMYFNL